MSSLRWAGTISVSEAGYPLASVEPLGTRLMTGGSGEQCEAHAVYRSSIFRVAHLCDGLPSAADFLATLCVTVVLTKRTPYVLAEWSGVGVDVVV